jgi:hypothetical protein
MNIYTFEKLWADFHFVNRIRKQDKDRCRNIWDKCNFGERKVKAIKEIILCDNVYIYLKSKLL